MRVQVPPAVVSLGVLCALGIGVWAQEPPAAPATPGGTVAEPPAAGETVPPPTAQPATEVPSYVHQAPPTEPTLPEPQGPRMAVFPFGNLTVSKETGYLELGFRELLQGLMEDNTGLDVVTMKGVDRAIRRHGFNPVSYIPLTELADIAKELGCDYVVGGFFYNLQTEYCLRGVLLRFTQGEKPFLWPVDALFTGATDAEGAARRFCDQIVALVSAQATQQACTFWFGQRVKLRVTSDADRVLISLADPTAVAMSGLRYRVIEGRQVSEVSVTPSREGGSGQIAVANTHPEGTRRRGVVDIWTIMDTASPQLALRVDRAGEGTVLLEVYNENRPEEPRLVKSLQMEAWTTSSQFVVDFDPLRRDGPAFVVARPFAPEEGSVPLASAQAAPAPAAAEAETPTTPPEPTSAAPAPVPAG